MAERKMESAVQRFKLECERRKKIEKKLKQRLAFEKTVSTISSRFIAVKNIDTAINQTLRDIGRLSGASRAYIFFFTKDGKTMSNTHEWCRKGVSPQIKNLQDIPSNSLPWWVAQLRKGNTIHITDVSKMPRAAKATQKLLESQDIKSLLVIPLYKEEKLVGFAGFDDVAKAGEWNDEDLMLLRICSEIVGKALESKRANDKLKESEEKYRILVDNIQDGVFIVIDGKLEYINEAFAKIPGYSVKEIMGRHFGNFVAPEDLDMVKDRYIRMLAGKKVPMDYEFHGIRKGSDERTTVHMTVGMIDYHGKKAAIGTIKNITEQNKAEAQRKESEKQFRALAEENPGMIYIHDFKGIVYANQKAAEVMGYTREQGYSKDFDFMKLVAPEFRPDIKKYIIKNMEGKEIEPFECTLITQKGKRIDVIMTTKLIQYRGKPAVLGIVTDITDRKKEEAKIKGYARELETKVKERTKEISTKIEDLERFHDLAVGRELKMIELKEQIKKLQKKLE